MIEYAISAGPGTLVDYGVADCVSITRDCAVIHAGPLGHPVLSSDKALTVITSRAASDCETGR